MIRANKLTQLKGPHNVGDNGEFGESRDFSKILPSTKVVGEMIRANKLNPARRAPKCWRIWRKTANLAKVAILAKFCQRCNPDKIVVAEKISTEYI